MRRSMSLVSVALGVLFVMAAVGPVFAQDSAEGSSLSIAEWKLGRGVANREILGEASTFDKGEKVYLWMRVEGGPSDPITVTWTYGEHSFTADLSIGGSPWRTWAYKTAYGAGEWGVRVTDAGGHELLSATFNVRDVEMKQEKM